MMRVLSFVEKGWAGARRVSIELAQRGVPVRHMVKGRLSRELVAALTPQPGMTIVGWPVRWYRVLSWAVLCRAVLGGGPAYVLVDNDRAARWVGTAFPGLRRRLLLVQKAADGSPTLLRQGRPVEPLALLPPRQDPSQAFPEAHR